MNYRHTTMAALAVVLFLTTMGLGAAASISNTSVQGQVVTETALREVSIRDSEVTHSGIEKASIRNSHVENAKVHRASVQDSYLEHLSIDRASVKDSRVAFASLSDVTLHDTTLCFASVSDDDFRTGQCTLVSNEGGELREHAWLTQDAPDTVSPGDHYDLEVEVEESGQLQVTNDPAGLTALGFDPTAADTTIDHLEVWADGESMGTFGLGESFDLDGHDRFTLRVHVAESGVIDGSTIGLVIDVGGHGLRTDMTSIDVVATSLGFAPLEQQAFAPFLADNVARLVISVAADDNGNVDRDLDIRYEVEVLHVATGHERGRGPDVGDEIQKHAFLHGDAELFSDSPFKYNNPASDAAHHPATLELILRDMVGVEGITYGAASFYATHLVAQSPYYTKVMLHASTTNADGDELDAEPLEIELTRLPEETRPVEHPFGPFGEKVFPGEGTLRVEFVDGNGDPVDRKAGWMLMIQETPESHQTMMHILYDEDGGSVDEQPLASSEPVGLPFGDFVPHEYKVCLHHDGGESCANDGDLVNIRPGETTTVRIVVE